MRGSAIQLPDITGLSGDQADELRRQFGRNVFERQRSGRLIRIFVGIIKEPMFVLLAIASSLYFILGDLPEGLMMLAAVALVTTISIYQEIKNSNALQALQRYTESKVVVLRDGQEKTIFSEELVPGDVVILSEGMNIPADAVILHGNDLTVNEAIITGESVPAEKSTLKGTDILYQGSTINSGRCFARVTNTGNNTTLGKIGKLTEKYQPPKTILQLQVNRFVRQLALFGLTGFLIIFLVNFLQQKLWVDSLLLALTLAMAAVPEEIPVAFSSFMALGAYKMSKLGIISRQPQILENLGAVTVICIDKTGTITENQMEVRAIYDYDRDRLIDLNHNNELPDDNVLHYAVLASETQPFDAMEKAILKSFELFGKTNANPQLKMVYEYPLEGRPPMMTHVYEHGGVMIATAKGAAERIIGVCQLEGSDKKKITGHANSLASHGYRIIAVSSAIHNGSRLPVLQDDFNWRFEGLLALYDPPKKNIPAVLSHFYDAKIQIKLLTGDSCATARNIASQVGILNSGNCILGENIMNMNETELKEVVTTNNIFARMFPEAKLKVIDALKANGEIVAMTGDGVNDGPALRSANIGIAMGQKGTEIARQASDLVLTDDNLDRMVTAISEGRKIFSNLKKAIRYIISIHIPIILTASLPLLLGWKYPNIFTPIHVIFLELIMGPTCSVFFEREPVEGNVMQQGPRKIDTGLFTKKELFTSVIQGLVIALGVLSLYYYTMARGLEIEITRTIVFTTLIISNIFLTFTGRSSTQSIYYTWRYKNSLVPIVLLTSILFLFVLHNVSLVRNLFYMAPISGGQFFICIVTAFASVMWIEINKTWAFQIK